MDDFILLNNTKNEENLLLKNLIKNQIKDIDLTKKFTLSDIRRLTNNLNDDIFGDNCVLWNGPILNSNNKDYISFFIQGKKYSLNRLLYINYKENLKSNEYLKYSCENNGKCCTINHLIKIKKSE
jgi:hypothetical protein